MLKMKRLFRLFIVPLFFVAFSCAADSEIFDARVASVETEYTNIDTNLSIAKLKENGMQLGDQIQFEHQSRVMYATYGAEYTDVKRGGWIATENEDGTLELAISFGGACEEINCKVGDPLLIQLITKE